MLNDRFGQFLVNNNLVDEGAVVEALNIQRTKKVTIGQIAISENILNSVQVFKILNKQIGTAKLFGQVATEMGYMTNEDLQRILAIQREGVPHVGDILVLMKKIDRVTCDRMLDKFNKKEIR